MHSNDTGMSMFWRLMRQRLDAKYNTFSILSCTKKNNFSYWKRTILKQRNTLQINNYQGTIDQAYCLWPAFPCFNMAANFWFSQRHSTTKCRNIRQRKAGAWSAYCWCPTYPVDVFDSCEQCALLRVAHPAALLNQNHSSIPTSKWLLKGRRTRRVRKSHCLVALIGIVHRPSALSHTDKKL